MLVQQLCFVFCISLCGAALIVGCKDGGQSAENTSASSKPADPLAKLTTTGTNIGQALFSIEHPSHYKLSRIGEGDTVTLAWGGNPDTDPVIMLARANPTPASLDEAVGYVAVGSRQLLQKEESPERFLVITKDGDWTSVTVWTRTKPMLRCQVDIETKTENDPRIAHAKTWCSSIKMK